ncbi:MAG: ROK family protein [Pseudonocardiaceae bacterium]|nr:ROK family protein [Pseudonocardiaceae bacterium]
MVSARGFGVDIGGSGIKAAPVDLRHGELLEERLRHTTPQPATPDAVAEVVSALVGRFGCREPIGITLPCVIKQGIACTAANVDPSWKGTDATALFTGTTGVAVVVLNDADAAGLAEMRFGAGQGRDGVVMLLTFGTGIGSSLFHDGELVPNTELGHLQVDGHDAEHRAAASVRETENLSWADWTRRVSRYLQMLEDLVWPDLIIVGGGVSRKADSWLPMLDCRTEVVPAALRNNAGIVGAAAAAAEGRTP